MAYSLANDSVCGRKRMADSSAVRPKTHTPGSPLQKPGLRFYNPGIGRWVNRDPNKEHGGGKLYVFTANNPLGVVDPFGMIDWSPIPEDPNLDENFHPWPGTGEPSLDNVTGVKRTARTELGHEILIWTPAASVTLDQHKYFCHGYTFDGHTAAGGPYSPFSGNNIGIIVKDEWVQVCCGMASGNNIDIVVFFVSDDTSNAIHSGKIKDPETSVPAGGAQFDEVVSTVNSKRGPNVVAPHTFKEELNAYPSAKNYRCYTKPENAKMGCCPRDGDHEKW